MALAAVIETTSDVLRFHIHWDVLGLIAFLSIGYLYGISRLGPLYAPGGEPAVTGRQKAMWFSGVALLAVVSTWPVHDIGTRSLFTFHMTEHMVMALLVPPLMLAGIPWWFLRRLLLPILPAVRWVTKPLVALLAFNGVLAAMHAPQVVELMVTSEPFHFVAHSVFLLAAFVMWWPVIGPIPDIPRLEPLPRIGYLFLQSLVPTVPASFLTLAEGPVYRIYETFPRLWGFDVLADQTIAGLIMKLGGGAVLWTVIAITWFRWAADEERAATGVNVG